MVKKINKLLLLGALAPLLIGCGSNPVNNYKTNYFAEDATDVMSGNGINFLPKKIGSSETVNVSSIYAQYGIDAEGNSCLRFATAIQGEISNISYTRKGIEGIDNGANKTIDVTTVYKSIFADGQEMFYDGTTPSATTGEGDYYWACYTICYKSEDASKYYDTDVEMVLTINGEALQTKVASLNDVKNVSKEKSYFYQAELTNYTNGSKTFGVEDMSTRKCLGNTNGNVGGVISFDIESSNAANAALYVAGNERSFDINLGEALKIEVNNQEIKSDNVIEPKVEGFDYWFMFREYKLIDMPLIQGTNKVSITILGSELFTIDYFKVVTKAEVTNSHDIDCAQLCNTCEKCIDPSCGYHEDKCLYEGVNTYRFDAKDATLAGGCSVEAGDFVGNTGGSSKSITFKVNADKQGKASLSAAVTPKTNATLFSSLFTATVNGNLVDLSNIYLHKMGADLWFDFVEMGLGCITLNEGENTIVFNGGVGGSFDHIMINTDSVLNNNETTHHHLCPTCNKSVDMECRTNECTQKCEVAGEKYEFVPNDATLIGKAGREKENTVIGGISGNTGSGVSYTFSVEQDTTIGLSIELSYQVRKALFSNTMDIMIDGKLYVSAARKPSNWNNSADWNNFSELYLGCVDLTAGEHTISFTTNTSNSYVTSNIRNFFVTSSSTITK